MAQNFKHLGYAQPFPYYTGLVRRQYIRLPQGVNRTVCEEDLRRPQGQEDYCAGPAQGKVKQQIGGATQDILTDDRWTTTSPPT